MTGGAGEGNGVSLPDVWAGRELGWAKVQGQRSTIQCVAVELNLSAKLSLTRAPRRHPHASNGMPHPSQGFPGRSRTCVTLRDPTLREHFRLPGLAVIRPADLLRRRNYLRGVGSPSEPRDVVPFDCYHYLGISLRCGGFTRDDWRADAKAAADAILESIRIESQ